jgi:phospholipid/cholesterol/gamma-HCH transport system substrate-binding protein
VSDAGNAFRAGLVIVVGAVLGTTFYVLSEKRISDANLVPYHAFITDAGGINAKSQITIAGLQVGQITKHALVQMTYAEYVTDFEARVLHNLGFPGSARVLPHDDFDAQILLLIDRGGLPSKAEIARDKLDEASVRASVQRAKKLPIRVARIEFSVNKDWPLPTDTWMRKGSLGLLGANALFLDPGTSEQMLKPNDRLVYVASMSEMNALLAQAKGIVANIGGITEKLDTNIGGITEDIKGITGELNRFINGDENTKPLSELYQLVMTDLRKLAITVEDAVKNASKLIKDNDSEFNKLVANVQRITKDLSDLTSTSGGGVGADGGPEQPGDIRATMSSVRQMTDDLSVVTSQLRELLGDDEATTDGIKELKSTITELNRSLTSLSEVMGRVERGEGTVGRLLTDEKIADKVEAAVSGASDFVAGLTSLETHIDVGTWYNFQREANTTTVSLKLQPKPDKYYLIEVVDDGGRLERYTERDIDGNVTRTSVREEDNQLRFTAMFAKRFFDFLVLRAGLIETTGGVGANVFFLENRVELRSDLFNFRGPRDTLATDPLGWYLPRWRTVLKAQPIPHLYVSAGVDDVLNAYSPGGFQLYQNTTGFGFDYFLGVGLTFKDDDLRSILPFIPGG